jgi:hypothetical protein
VPRIPQVHINYMKLPRVCYEVPMIAYLIPTSLPFIEITYFTALAYSKFHKIGESETLQVHWAAPMAAHGGWSLVKPLPTGPTAYHQLSSLCFRTTLHMTHMPNLIPLCYNNCIGMRSTCLEEHVPTASYCYDVSLRRQMHST